MKYGFCVQPYARASSRFFKLIVTVKFYVVWSARMQGHWIYDWERKLRNELADVSRSLERDIIRVRDSILSCDAYVFRDRELEALANEIAEETELSRLTQLIWKAAIRSGFQNASLFVLEQGKGSPFKSRVCSSYPEKWRQRYIDQKYQFVDPVVYMASIHKAAFTFSEARGASSVEAEFWADAEEYGVGTNGLAVPVRLKCEALIVVTFATSVDRRLADMRCDEHSSDLSMIAEIAAEAFSYLGRSQPISNSHLSQDELRYLHILVASDDPSEARLVKTTFGSIKSIEHSIREKLGVKTILQAVAIASKKNFFDEVDFCASDVNPLCAELSGWELFEDDRPEKNEPTVFDGFARQADV